MIFAFPLRGSLRLSKNYLTPPDKNIVFVADS